MSMKTIGPVQSLAAVPLALFVVNAAHAQTTEPNALAEIVVTAEKRESTLQETPISMTALTGAELSAQGLVSTESLAAVTPGLTIEKDVIGKVVIRGVGTENYTVGSDPGVAIYQDGIYIARSSVSMFDFFDTGRVEVLRGPQGTLYGRNATGGVINIASNEPTATLGGYTNVDFGNYNKRRIETAFNAPVNDMIETRFSLLYATRAGYDKNIFPGAAAVPANPATGFPGVPAISSAASRDVDQLDNENLLTGRAQVKFKFSDDLSLLLLGQFDRDKSLPPANKYFDPTNAYWFSAFPQNKLIPNLRTVSQDFSTLIPGSGRTIPSVGGTNEDAISAKLKWRVGNLDFTSLSGWRKTDFSWLDDGDGYDVFFVNYFQTDHSTQFTQEFQLSNVDKEKIDWIVGAYYLNEKSKTFEGIPFLYFGPNPASPYLLWDGITNTKSYSAYAQGTYHWTDQLRSTLGIRYNIDRKDGDLIYNPFGLAGASPAAEPLNGSWSSTTPKFGIDYDIAKDVMSYLSITKGFKSGGFNLLAVQSPYSPETLWAYELGLKTKSFDGRLIANFSFFYYDYTNMQVGKVVDLSAEVANAAKSTIKGAEIELRAAPGAGFEIDGGIALLDAKYDQFITQDPGFTGNPAAPGGLGCGAQVGAPTVAPADPNRTINLAGCQIPRASKFQGNLGLQWSTPLAVGALHLRTDYAYRTSQFFTQFNRAEVSQPGYGVLGARASYSAPSDRWSVTLYGDNLVNRTYFSDVLESGVAAAGTVVPQAVIGAPRTFGISLKANY
jgi:iron complex outermembrane receptor protein